MLSKFYVRFQGQSENEIVIIEAANTCSAARKFARLPHNKKKIEAEFKKTRNKCEYLYYILVKINPEKKVISRITSIYAMLDKKKYKISSVELIAIIEGEIIHILK